MMTKPHGPSFINRYNIIALVAGVSSLFLYGATLVEYITEDYVSLTEGAFDKQLSANHLSAVITSFFILISPLRRRVLGFTATTLAVLTTVMLVYTSQDSFVSLISSVLFSLLFLLPSIYIFRSGQNSAMPEESSKIKLLIIGLALTIVVGFSFVLGISGE
jgi:hypothetical protein